MQSLHSDIIKGLEDGTFLDNLERIAGQNLTHLSFWGTEPALTLGVIEKKLDEIQARFPKVRNMSFSTSMVMPAPIVKFAKELERRNLRLDVQVSLDGPAFIVDKNRFPGAAQRIPSSVIAFVEAMQDANVTVDLRWKSTLTNDNIADMEANPELIDEYINFFREIEERVKSANQNPSIRLNEGGYVPSLAVPGKYTSEDGKVFASFLRKLHDKGYVSAYTSRLMRLVNFSDELGSKRKMFTCSGGDSNVGVGDSVHICHRSFYLNDDRYVKSVLDNAEINNWDISIFNQGSIDMLKKWYMPKVDDEMKLQNFDYIMRGYHDFWAFKVASVEAMARDLALAGQAEEIFLRNKDYLSLFSLFMVAAHSCPMEAVLNTGSLQLTPVSLIRMFGNGAFREILKTIK